jgi:uncharacterized membrane protein
MRNIMGSWRFVTGFVAFMVVWAILNTTMRGWDPYPFILLNLFLSMLAGLQGAILLIAARRQDGISAALAQHDFDTNAAAKIDIESLLEINNRQLLMLAELHQILATSAVHPTGASAVSASLTRPPIIGRESHAPERKDLRGSGCP